MSPPTESAVGQLLETLQELPPFQDVVFRGWNDSPRWSSGAGTFVTTGLNATSRDPRVATENFTTTGLYAVLCRTGRAIEQFSADRTAREVALLPSTVLLWGRQVRVGDLPVTIIEEVVLDPQDGPDDHPLADPDDLARAIAGRVQGALQREPVTIGQPGRFVGSWE